MYTDTRLLKAKTEDLFRQCERHCEAKFSPFLDGGKIAFIEDHIKPEAGFNTMFFGGYDGAERKMYGVFPEWEEADKESFPISIVHFDAPKFRTLSHRDYLGTLMSLGIDRSKTGDILTDEGGAYIMLEEQIAGYVLANMSKIANAGVKGRIISPQEFTPPPPKTKTKSCVAASPRLDAVIAAAFNISRTASENLVKDGFVKINHREAASRSAQLEAGDLISVRGHGRFILKETGSTTGKGRLHITVEIFV